MEPELGSVDFVGKSRTKKNVCSQANGNLDCSQHIKIVEPTLLGGSPWSLC